ncbi:MAG: Trk system potassium transporter TrkA [Ruminococcaceae bacterium]|nr:Trk system potassium transporter TrkA [Oscillospiraceae bacterium]
MKIIVVGCGKIGTALIESLVAEEHDIIVIDSNRKVLEEINNIYDVMCVCGNGADSDVLEEADAASADLFIAVTNSDELNMLSCFFARKMGAKHTVARIRKTDYNDKSLNFMKQTLSLSMPINPEFRAAKEFYNIIKMPSAVKIESFSSGNFEMLELRLRPDSRLHGMTLSEMRGKFKANFLICAVQRDGKVFIPSGNFTLRGGDKIGLTANQSEILKLLKELNLIQKHTKSVTILGGSRIAFYLAKRLVAAGNSVKIIEQNIERCEEISELLPEVSVIHADGTQQEVLEEEGISRTDAFVALTGIDEENILISFFASRKGVPKVISKVNREELAQIAEDMGLDCVISPKRIIADAIIQYARALQNSMGSKVETLYKLMDSNIEALEFKVSPEFREIETPLRDMQLKSQILIAGIIRGRKTIIPAGDDVILPGDRVIIIAGQKGLQDLSDILR